LGKIAFSFPQSTGIKYFRLGIKSYLQKFFQFMITGEFPNRWYFYQWWWFFDFSGYAGRSAV